MKASRFSDAQKAFILKQGADGMPVADICRKAGISQATYFNWKKKYDGLLPTEMRRLKQLEDKNSKLRKVVADLNATTARAPKPKLVFILIAELLARGSIRGVIGRYLTSSMSVRSKRQSDTINAPRIGRNVGIDGDAKPGLVQTADIMGPHVGKRAQLDVGSGPCP